MAGSTLAALRSRDFRLLFLGQLVSLTGSQMQRWRCAWQIYMLTGSPLALGFLGLARVIPVILFALGGGVIADALDRRELMLSQALHGGGSLTLPGDAHRPASRPPSCTASIGASGGARASRSIRPRASR